MKETEEKLLGRFLEEIKEAEADGRKLFIIRATENSDCTCRITLERTVWHENRRMLYIAGVDDFELSINIDSIEYDEINAIWDLLASKETTSITILGSVGFNKKQIV